MAAIAHESILYNCTSDLVIGYNPSFQTNSRVQILWLVHEIQVERLRPLDPDSFVIHSLILKQGHQLLPVFICSH